MDDKIDIEALQSFCDENPVRTSPEGLLEDAIEMLDEGNAEDQELVLEATIILMRWEQMALIGSPMSLEEKRFEAEAFFAKHKFAGAEGVPVPEHLGAFYSAKARKTSKH